MQTHHGNYMDELGWHLTPYACAILNCYDSYRPLTFSVPTNFDGTALQKTHTDTYQVEQDVLIVGCHSAIGTLTGGSPGNAGQGIMVRVQHSETNINFNSSAPLHASPVTALAGFAYQPCPIQGLPEAFFLPALTRLRHYWRNDFINDKATGGALVWHALKLYKPKGGRAPQQVQLDDGTMVKVGGRLPWWWTVGIGTETSSTGGNLTYSTINKYKYDNYTEPQGDLIEVHGVNANFFQYETDSTTPTSVKIKLGDFGQPQQWAQKAADYPALAGSFSQGEPMLQFARPYPLEAGHRFRITTQNLTGSNISETYLTFAGVRVVGEKYRRCAQDDQC
jgi:hypothetical protein